MKRKIVVRQLQFQFFFILKDIQLEQNCDCTFQSTTLVRLKCHNIHTLDRYRHDQNTERTVTGNL